jgi:hypothetical protein
MKRLFILFFAGLFIIACNDRQQGAPGTTGGAANNKEPSPDARAAEAQQKTEELQKLVPLTIDQMKALLPESVAGWPRFSAAANASLGAPFSTGQYQLNDSVFFDVNIYDCAGQEGAGIYNRQYLAAMDFKPASDIEADIIDFKGSKALEHLDKVTHIASFTFMSNDRFLVSVEGKNIEKEVLRKAGEGVVIKVK